MYDCAIIGGGPAGLSAAINLKRRGKTFVWFGSAASQKIEKSEQIANYPGLLPLSGSELNRRFAEHTAALGIEATPGLVTQILQMTDHYVLLAENEMFEAVTVLLCIGAVTGKGFENEEAFLGRGVSYCATCDGFLYRGKTAAVYAASERFESDVSYLAETCGQIYLYCCYDSPSLERPNVTRLVSPVQKVTGENRVSGVVLADGSEVKADGLFCLRDAVSPQTLLPRLSMDGPHIVVGRGMETNLPGCFAAGDCTGRPYQIAKAVGEGNVAAHSVLEYLQTLS